MSEPGPPNPFEGMPWLGDLARLLSSQGPIAWDVARQLAYWMATDGQPEANIEPLTRLRIEELVRVADLQVGEHTNLEAGAGGVVTVTTVTRSEWARRGLDAYRPLLERLATAMSIPGDAEERTTPDPETDLLGGLAQMLSPVLLGMQAGFMVGHLARRAFGQYDLPIPRPPSNEIVVVPTNIDAFAEEWSVPIDDLRLWIALHELTHHAVLGRPHVRDRLLDLLLEYAAGFEIDPNALPTRLDDLDPTDPSTFQSVLGDPEALLGAMQSDAQRRLLPQLEALTSVIEGYVDHVMDSVGRRLIGSYGMLTEALRRRRVESTTGDRYVARLFGLELSQGAYDRGGAFVRGVVERGGPDALNRLWASGRELPTPAEVDAPGLWLARIDLPD